MSEDYPNFSKRPTATEDRPSGYRFYDDGAPGNQPPVAAPIGYSNQQNYYRQMALAKDEAQLDQLSLAFKIYAGVNALLSCVFIFHIIMGIMMLSGGFDDGIHPPDRDFGWFFVAMGAGFMSLGWTLSACNFYAGKFLKERRRRTFCFVMSCIDCMSIPFGLILGILSLTVLSRESVKEMFARNDLKG